MVHPNGLKTAAADKCGEVNRNSTKSKFVGCETKTLSRKDKMLCRVERN